MDKSTRVLPFDFSSVEKPAHTRTVSVRELWMAIVFPRLALELYRPTCSQSIAVVEQVKGRGVVVMASAEAECHGVVPGMSVSAAYTLCQGLKTVAYDPVAIKKKLQRLAAWANGFSSKVHVQLPQTLLLEVQGSLRLYGGLQALQNHINEDLRQGAYTFQVAVTPTPIASFLLANSGRAVVVQQMDSLRSVLGGVPIEVLPIPANKKKQLYNSGLRRLRDVWRLPKAALARRVGPELLLYLERALGEAADLRESYRASERFEAAYDLSYELNDKRQLLDMSATLFAKLEKYLWRRDWLLYGYRMRFLHHTREATCIRIALRYPSRDQQHLQALLQTRLEPMELQAPVIGLLLQTRQFLAHESHSDSLFTTKAGGMGGQGAQQSSLEQLLQQLQTRLGASAIQYLHAVAEHRPEYAVRVSADALSSCMAEQLNRRPLWLLPTPRLLRFRAGKLWYEGELSLLSGPERIESGWWSGADVRRDYYIAADQQHRRLWVYRELRGDKDWYLQGLFA
ncbi:MAG: DNA polymerase Y family protein [Gammaproteobacteria bacterium]|nr:DNA polymerase Y family protein [Gammaproteobacteria bacterium]MDH5800961.1 DNA polymerase Y family protein [Gammaproteobacteria bacterium]